MPKRRRLGMVRFEGRDLAIRNSSRNRLSWALLTRTFFGCPMLSSDQPTQDDSGLTRLRGEALQKWYAHSSNLSPQQWEAEQKRQEEERSEVAKSFLWFAFPLFFLLAPISGSLLTAIFGVWLVIGSGNFWWRVVLTMGSVVILGLGSPFLYAWLLLILFVSTTLAYASALLLPSFYLLPCRPVQFTLWQIGGCIIILAASMALLRDTGFSLDVFENRRLAVTFFLVGPLVALNVVVASLPMLVPTRYRTAIVFRSSALLVLIVLPIVELVVIHRFLDTRWYHYEFDAFLIVSHLVGPLVVWLLVYTMEGALAFCEVAPPLLGERTVEEDPFSDVIPPSSI